MPNFIDNNRIVSSLASTSRPGIQPVGMHNVKQEVDGQFTQETVKVLTPRGGAAATTVVEGGKDRPRPSEKPRPALPIPSVGPFGCGPFSRAPPLSGLLVPGAPCSDFSRFVAGDDTGGGNGSGDAAICRTRASTAGGIAGVGSEIRVERGVLGRGMLCERRMRPASAA